MKAVVLAVSVALASSSAVAQATKPFAAPQVSKSVSSGSSLLEVTLSLLIVLAAVFAAAWLMRRLRSLGKRGAGSMEIVADVALGAKERAVVLRVGKERFLVGVAPGRVNLLHVISSDTAFEEDKPEIVNSAGGGQDRPDFKAILRQSLGLK